MSKVPPERSVFALKKCTCETEKGVKQQKSGEISEGTSMGGTPCQCLDETQDETQDDIQDDIQDDTQDDNTYIEIHTKHRNK